MRTKPKHRPWMPGVCVYHPTTTELNVIYWYLHTAAKRKQAKNNTLLTRRELASIVDRIITNMMEQDDD